MRTAILITMFIVLLDWVIFNKAQAEGHDLSIGTINNSYHFANRDPEKEPFQESGHNGLYVVYEDIAIGYVDENSFGESMWFVGHEHDIYSGKHADISFTSMLLFGGYEEELDKDIIPMFAFNVDVKIFRISLTSGAALVTGLNYNF